jgi:heme o synthase
MHMAQKHNMPSKLHGYLTLTKPEVNLLVLMTTTTGFYLGSHKPLHAIGLAYTLSGTLLVASGTATLNQWMERGWDGQMRRTANRPLPSGRVTPREAFWFGMMLSIAGGLFLAITVNRLASALAITTLLSYLLIYTPLKRKTSMCTLLGAIPGAMPALIGWAGAGASIGVDARAWFLFLVVFLWQFPHFLAIALMYRDDYSRAGYNMLPDFDGDGSFTRKEIVGTSLLLIMTTLLLASRAGPLAIISIGLAGLFLLYHAVSLMKTRSRVAASRLIHASVLYLPIVLVIATAYKI